MAVVFVVVDDRGNVVRLERRETEGLIGAALENQKALREFTAPQTLPLQPGPELFQFRDISQGIDQSPRLNEEQRAEARRVFNSFVPGDSFKVVRERPIIRQGGDVPRRPAPLFTVFVDP